jgi:hypothetical protein
MAKSKVWSTGSDPPDPIFAAIDAHREAAKVFDVAFRAGWKRNGYAQQRSRRLHY